MFKFLIGLLIFGALVAIWVTIIRPVLRSEPWAEPFFLAIEPFELWVYKKSETILWARFKMLIGVILTTLTQIGAIDITPLMPFVPDEWEPLVRFGWNLLPMLITILGMIDERMRNDTTKPIELVALTEKEKEKPAVAEAITAAEVTKVEAVAAVEVEKIKDAA